MRQTTDLDFLLYPLAIDDIPRCPECSATTATAVLEAREDSPVFSTFLCPACQRWERFVIEGAAGLPPGVTMAFAQARRLAIRMCALFPGLSRVRMAVSLLLLFVDCKNGTAPSRVAAPGR